MGDTYKAYFEPLLRRQKYHCYYCNTVVSRKHSVGHPNKATIDHKQPRCRGGTNLRMNLVIACEPCNARKGNMTEVEFRYLLVRKYPVTII